MLNGKKLLCVGKYGEDVKKLIEQLGGSVLVSRFSHSKINLKKWGGCHDQ